MKTAVEANQMEIVKIMHLHNIIDARHFFLPEELKSSWVLLIFDYA